MSRRIGRDFWIENAERPGLKCRRVFHRGGGIRPASDEEAALWDRLLSERILPRTPRWFFEAHAAASGSRSPEGTETER